MGRLEICVCGARNVANRQKIGMPDPYVKLRIIDEKKSHIKYKTRVVENSCNPVWNELFKFQVADYDSTQVLLELWNDNIMVDDHLGSYRLSVNGLTRGVVKDTWVILSGTKGASSELHLRMLAVDFGRDPGPDDPICTTLENEKMEPITNQTYRPPNKLTPPAQATVLSPHPAASQWKPQPVVFSAPAVPMTPTQYNYSAMSLPPQPGYSPVPPPQPQGYGYSVPPPPQPMYGVPPPPQPMYGVPPPPQPMYGVPPPPQPMYGVPQPQPRPVYTGGPPPPGVYGPCPPQQRPVQMAYGIPPDM
ncbi:hypothetical protein JKF63_03818 [Porcisia hertigi]|uniref:C2 domain-containing protein n=1 Tax=Porcisia hertigi TaxID=2761500 RepID=A0A836L441_9TRYP|nr:hypothetical protein JKF63_03818 [Porcisia hertigi]